MSNAYSSGHNVVVGKQPAGHAVRLRSRTRSWEMQGFGGKPRMP